ncbi:hypothetical protein DWW36_15765 [Erysipelotrichaceae bacterium AF15-26LB]|nr:hypothetical protein DWX45_19585 [Erysipelotrichaceae bacterium AF19-24AC]RJV85062.1 hypothetical protein DWW36_15765 [Erysipelotrichaceae bacterium AF15-26LB]
MPYNTMRKASAFKKEKTFTILPLALMQIWVIYSNISGKRNRNRASWFIFRYTVKKQNEEG